ncbi:MAG: UvrB/UvrC motif-containing protein [bacterium]
MLCDVCQKEEATIFYKEMVNNKYSEMHLCEKCAYEQGVKKFQLPSAITNLLSALTELSPEALPRQMVEKKCPGCNSTYSDFRERGKLGCSQCYQAFNEPLADILRKIHGNIQHIGKSPLKVAVTQTQDMTKIKEIEALRKALDEAVKREEYEEAANLRDKIRDLEKEIAS